MFLSRNLLTDTYKKIRDGLPDFVFRSIIKLLPLFLIASIFEILGLAIIIPVINLLLEPALIQNNKYIFWVYNYFGFNNSVSFVLFLLCIICGIFIVKNVFMYLILKYQTKTGFTLASRLAINKFNTYLKKPYGFYTENNSAILLRNITQLPLELVIYNIFSFVGLLNELFVLFIIILAMTLYNPILFLATIVFIIPFLLLYDKVYKNKLKQISAIRDKESSNAYKIGLQSMEGFREITVFDKLNFFKPIFKKSMDAYTKASASSYLLNTFTPKIVETVALMCLVNIFLFGYFFGENIQVLTQFMAIFAIAAYRIIPSINKIILFSNYIKSSAYIFQYFNKEDEEDEIAGQKDNAATSTSLSFFDKLEIKNISFKYNGSEENIINNLNLTIQKGKTIGIVGPSGSGKSTLLNILLRLYEEESGGIYVDNIKIEKENRSQWYKLVSYVPQNMILLDSTIKENIAFGIEPKNIDNDLLQKVITRSQLDGFINKLQNGVETHIGEKGIKISGGQKQRIAIARALYHSGQILIFDEATSSLDTETEEMLTEAIHTISHQELTIIIVSHRLQTLKYCDAIYKLENGELIITHYK